MTDIDLFQERAIQAKKEGVTQCIPGFTTLDELIVANVQHFKLITFIFLVELHLVQPLFPYFTKSYCHLISHINVTQFQSS